jgi:hypothetical protein
MFTSQASLSSMLLTHSTTTMLSSTITKHTQQQNLIPQKQNTNKWMYGSILANKTFHKNPFGSVKMAV